MSESKIKSEEELWALVWSELSSVPVDNSMLDFIPKGKNVIPYLKWATGYKVLRNRFPCSGFTFKRFLDQNGVERDYAILPDGSAYVEAKIWIKKGGYTIESSMDLPIYGSGHRAIKDFTSADLNTAKQRCRVKLLATLGLAIDIYGAGQDRTYNGKKVIQDESVSEMSRLDPLELAIKENLLKKARGFKKINQDSFFTLCVDLWKKKTKGEVSEINHVIDRGEEAVRKTVTYMIDNEAEALRMCNLTIVKEQKK